MKEANLSSSITQDIRVETHNDYKAFILHQSIIAAKQRPAVSSSIVMTSAQLVQLVQTIGLLQILRLWFQRQG